MSYSGIEIKSTGRYLKIDQGFPHQLRLLSDTPQESIQHGYGKESYVCTGQGCIKCQEGHEAKQRFTTKVYDHGLQRVMEWSFGGGIARQLKEIDSGLAKDGVKITDVDLKVSCSGAGLQKKYMVMPWQPTKPLPPGLLDEGVPF